MIYLRIDDRNRIIDIVDTSDPHVMIGNPIGLVETDMTEPPNAQLFAEDLIPLYKWDGENMVERDSKEIESDRTETAETPSQLDVIEAQVTYTAMMTDTLLEV